MIKNNAEAIIESQGKKYLDDLITVRRMANDIVKSGIKLPQDEVGSIDVVRAAILGPLSREGFTLGRAMGVRRKNTMRVVNELLSDKKKLAEAIRLKDARADSARWKALMSSVGLEMYMAKKPERKEVEYGQ
jgi:hypothetical protein